MLLLVFPACSHEAASNISQTQNARVEAESTPARKPARIGFVNDFAGVIKDEERIKLDESARELIEVYGVDPAIVTVSSLEGEPIEKTSLEFGREWKVGAQRGDGIVLFLALNDRQSRIDVTRSLEPVLTNEECKRILKQARPLLKEGQYGRACEEVLRSIKEVLKRSRKS
jgi:uncharacterized protein